MGSVFSVGSEAFFWAHDTELPFTVLMSKDSVIFFDLITSHVVGHWWFNFTGTVHVCSVLFIFHKELFDFIEFVLVIISLFLSSASVFLESSFVLNSPSDFLDESLEVDVGDMVIDDIGLLLKGVLKLEDLIEFLSDVVVLFFTIWSIVVN